MTGSGDNVNGVHHAAVDYPVKHPDSPSHSNEPDQRGSYSSSPRKTGTGRETRFFPRDIEHDLDGVPGLSEDFIHEALATSWEYARCVIPSYTNWNRYVAFMRTVTVGILVEVDSTLIDIFAEDFRCGGQTIDEILSVLFGGTPGEEAEMGRDYWTFLVTTAEKTGNNKNHSVLFHRYVSALAESPRSWFRIRDADALARFTAAAALACNDVVSAHLWFSEAQWKIIGELAVTLYDSVAFYKHRAEGETNNTFAYALPHLRTEANRVAREVLWALDTMWLDKPGGVVDAEERNARLAVVNFVRLIGGPIHLTMRRYRFIEDGLKIGWEEDEEVVRQTREHFKLWNRVDVDENGRGGLHRVESGNGDGMDNGDGIHRAGENGQGNGNGYSSGVGARRVGSGTSGRDDALKVAGRAKYTHVLENKDRFLFPGLAELLELQATDIKRCGDCRYRRSYGAEGVGQFGGVGICGWCQEGWRAYIESFPRRAVKAFPELRQTPLSVN